MNVRAITWMGVQTQRFDEMRAFMETLLGTPPPVTEPGFALWDLPSGDLVELFAHGSKPTFGSGPVVGFLVDDLDAARRQLEAAGGEVVSTYGPNEDGYEAVHFRAPDGNVYELVRDPVREARAERRRA
ncbi:MAG: VOC family protein [Actinomycetota bacterium]|nr:VOC family protein [Actinomycetota bacterium]